MASGTLEGAGVVRLSDLVDGQEGEFFAALADTIRGIDKHGNRYIKCQFRDKRALLWAPVWSSDPLLPQAEAWIVGEAYRIKARRKDDPKFGAQLNLVSVRAVAEVDKADGYEFFDLVESSKYPPGTCYHRLLDFIESYIQDEKLNRLVARVLASDADLFQKMPAAQKLHHGFVGGLAEHVWSVTRVCIGLMNHYASYYDELNPPLNKDVVVAAAILHDIGKLKELRYHPVEARYTIEGTLIGHILMGRDLVRDTAREIGDFPEETLMLLEHAILAHHGKPEFGAPKPPQTLEALIVHYADELDAKMNAIVQERMRPANSDDPFTSKIYAVENRRFYRGVPVSLPVDDDLPPTS